MRRLLPFIGAVLIGCGNGEPTPGPDAGYCPNPNSGYVACGQACCEKGKTQCTSAQSSTCCPLANACGDSACCGEQEQCTLGATGAGTCCNAARVCHGLGGAVTCCTGPTVCNQNGTGCACPPATTLCFGDCCTASQTCDSQTQACAP